MAKTATKRKEHSAASIKRRLTAALVMLLVSSVMLVTSTYAWFTLSTAPEVKGIDTSVAGNGSLEIALMPNDGSFSSITSGRGASGLYAGGTAEATAANNAWGNIVNLSNEIYGLNLITLKPARINLKTEIDTETVYFTNADGCYVLATDETTVISDNQGNLLEGYTMEQAKIDHVNETPRVTNQLEAVPFQVPVFGYDGRIASLTNTALRSHYVVVENDPFSADANGFTYTNGGTQYGVRAIVDASNDTYGYVIDLAFRLNTLKDDGTTGKLLLQVDGAQRVYADSSANATQGAGSNFWFQDENNNDVTGVDQNKATECLKAVRFAFVKNLGNANAVSTEVIAYARADINTGALYLCNLAGEKLVDDQENDIVTILDEMNKNQIYQISVVVWIDGDAVTNANLAVDNSILRYATLNLQFATDVELVPAENTNLHDNPPEAVTEAEVTPAAPTAKESLAAAISTATTAYEAAAESEQKAALEEAIATAQGIYDGPDAEDSVYNAQIEALEAAVNALPASEPEPGNNP